MTPPKEADEQAFKQMWVDARIRFQDLTKRSLIESTDRSLDDIVNLIDQKFDQSDPETHSKKKRIKELASNVLKFIDILGGIAAQGASMVFGPATMCSNALSFLTGIPTKISRYHSDLTHLFEEITTFMMRFKIYERIEQYAEIDVKLKRGTHKLLIIFIDICALSIDTLSGSRWKRLKTKAKISLFDNDSGVAEKLEDFKRVVAQQSQVSDAVTLEHVLKAEHELTTSMKTVFATLREASEDSRRLLEEKAQEIQDELRETHDDVKTVKAGTDTLVRDFVERTAQKESSDQVEKIREKLAIKSDIYEGPSKEFKQIRSKCLAGTGSWLTHLEEYQLWLDATSDTEALLLLSGENGSGKSHLLSSLFDKLQRQHLSIDSSSTRVSLACYSFKKNEKPSREMTSQNSRPSITAIQSMAVQIAKQDKVYAKNLASHLSSKDQSFARDISAMDLCKEMLLPPNMGRTSDAVFFMLFDGFDQLAFDEAADLLKALLAIESVKTRIVIASTGGSLDESMRLLGKESESLPIIEIGEHNQEDIKHYIDSELKALTALQGESAGLSRIIESIRQKLPLIVKGNFGSAKQIIERVIESVKEDQSEEEIEKLISEESLKDQGQLIEQIVAEYNESLNNQEIGQLNELLIWATHAYEFMSDEEMRAALFMRTERAPLQSLENKVKKYSKLFEIKKGFEKGFEYGNARSANLVLLKNDEIATYFREQKREIREADIEADDDPTISMTITIKNAKVSKVQRFFWDLSEKVVIDRFNFVNSLTNLKETATISANSAEGHLTLTTRCFDLLVDEVREETQILCRYAIENIMWHLISLRDAVNEGAVGLADREKILANIVSLLQSTDYVDRHLTDRFLETSCWILEVNGSVFQEWLRDPKTTGRLSRKDLNWLKHATDGPYLLALSTTASLIARHWLCNRKWSSRSLFGWLDMFLEQLGYKQLVAQPMPNSDTPYDRKETSNLQDANGNQDMDASNERPADKTDKDINTFETMSEGNGDHEVKAPEKMSVEARVSRAIDWAQHEAKIVEIGSLFYERLGATYLDSSQHDLAKKAYSKAKELPDYSWIVSEGLAKAYARTNEERMALQEMEIALTRLRESKNLEEKERVAFVEDLQEAAKWQAKLGEMANATEKLKEAIRLDPHNMRIRYKFLEFLLDADQVSEALDLLNEMRLQPGKDDSHNQLEIMMLDILSQEDEPLDGFVTIFSAAKGNGIFQVVLESLEKLLARARGDNRSSDLVDLLLCYGVGLEYHSSAHLALEHWEECCEIGFRGHNISRRESALSAARLLFSHHSSKVQPGSTTAENFETLSSKLKQLPEKARSEPYYAEQLRLALASFYNQAGKQDMARQLLLSNMITALNTLSDDDPENDWIAFADMFSILLLTGSKLDALSAMSLRGPKGRYNEQLELTMFCDGCKAYFQFSDTVWHCCLCDDVGFHRECLDKLRDGTLRRSVCSLHHEWLNSFSWEDDFKETGVGKVRMGGELQDGKRVGGRIVPIEEWLDSVREKWGIEKPKADAKVEEVVKANVINS